MATPAINLCVVQRRPGPPLPVLQKLARSKVGVFFFMFTFMAPGLLPFLCITPALILVSVIGIVSHFNMRRFMDMCIAAWLTYVTVSEGCGISRVCSGYVCGYMICGSLAYTQ